MSNDAFETVNTLCETTLQNCCKAGEAALETGKELLEANSEITKSLLEVARAKADKLAGAKDYQTFAAHQAELAQECSQIWIEGCQSIMKTLMNAGKTCQQMCEEGVKSANNNAAAGAAKKARKSA